MVREIILSSPGTRDTFPFPIPSPRGLTIMITSQTSYCGAGAVCTNNVGSVSCSCESGCTSWQEYFGCKQSISAGSSYSGTCSSEYSCRSVKSFINRTPCIYIYIFIYSFSLYIICIKMVDKISSNKVISIYAFILQES